MPSLAGAFAFLFPVRYDGALTIPMGVLNGWLNDWLSPWLSTLALIILGVSAVASPVFRFGPARWSQSYPSLARLFNVSPVWLLLRISAFLCAVLIVTETGPDIVWGETTGSVVFYDLVLAILTLFVVAVLLLPLLTDYGLMELVGALLSPVFRKLFTLPGRAAIDASASWFAAGTVGILITAQQYERGFYTAREACVIATNFSIVSLPFCLLVVTVLGLQEIFLQYYLTVGVVGLITAMILPRIPPLKNIGDIRFAGASAVTNEAGPSSLRGQLRVGAQQALDRAAGAPGPRTYFKRAIVNLFDIWFGLIPGVVVLGLAGLIIAEHTPIVDFITQPLVPLLTLMQVPEAAATAPTLLVGFAEMFLPAAMGKDIESELTRFVIAGVSVSQLIYMSEIGILILKSPIPLRLIDLFSIFLLRTAIALPLFVVAGYLIVGR